MTKLAALIRGEAGPTELTRVLDELKVKKGEHFIIASSAALNPSKPGYCMCDRPLQGSLFVEIPKTRPEADDALVAG
jgi:hypothetical protein